MKTSIKQLSLKTEAFMEPMTTNLCVYKIIYTTTQISEDGHLGGIIDNIKIEQGFSNVSSFESFMNGTSDAYDKHKDIMFVSKEGYDFLIDKGWFFSQENGYNIYNKLVKDEFVYDNFKNGINTIKDLVRANMNSNVLTRVIGGTIIPMCGVFNYKNGEITRDNYSLEKVIDILKDNNQIEFKKDKNNNPEILDYISYGYGEKNHHSSYVEFKFKPTEEQMLLIWNEQKKIKKQETDTAFQKAVINLDILKLKINNAVLED